MQINWKKTKVLTVKRGGGTCDIAAKGEKMEGALFNGEGSCDEAIENIIGAASKVIGALRSEVLERRELNKDTKFSTMVVPTLL